MQYFVYAVVVIVAAAIAAGFFVAGSPKEERLRQFDERRVGDLQSIQGQIVNYWQQKGRLPQALGDLTDSVSGFRAPTDPETGATYEYRAVASTTFELCAVFVGTYDAESKRAQQDVVLYPIDMRMGPKQIAFDQWSHGIGRYCFERTIDPELYPPIVKKPQASGGCVITGCSGQVCADKEVVTTCEFQPQYACYKQYSRCERQSNRECGWTPTQALTKCLSTPTESPSPPVQ